MPEDLIRGLLRLVGPRSNRVENQPVHAPPRSRVGALPGQTIRQRISRVLSNEVFEGVFDVRPPARVVSGLGLGLVDHLDASLPQLFEVRLDGRGRVQRIASAVDDEECAIAEVSGEEIADYADRVTRQNEQESVERQERGVGRRVAHRDVVGAGPAVGHAGDDHAILVDVVRALDGVEDRAKVFELDVAPPRRFVPRLRKDVDLFGAGEPADARGPASRVRARPTPPWS